jgi:hypothetical protein
LLTRLRQERAELEAGTGAYDQTEVGEAVRGLRYARADLQATEQAARYGRSWRDRHSARRRLSASVECANDAQHRWNALVAPELARLDGEIVTREAIVGQLTASAQRHRAVSGETGRRLLEAERASGALAHGLDAYRDQLDRLVQPDRTPAAARAAAIFARPSPACGPVMEPDLGPSL